MGIKKVHVVYKSHLDLGFTDLAASVVRQYLSNYIPAALDLAWDVNEDGKPPLFIWTVGSYLIDLARRTYTGDMLARLEESVRKGYITYHAMPYTLHSELCDAALFDAGMNITARLDSHYGRHTIAAKMSDVPGHTRGIIAPLVRQGVSFLHIGINDVACMAKLPPLFIWENTAGEQLIVNYTRSYGGFTLVEGHDEALVLQHTNDNIGAPSKESLLAEFAAIAAKYPDAQVCASSLDAFAAGLGRVRDTLPVVREEIGDTWIHGIGVDPLKTSRLRALTRLSSRWDQEGTWNAYRTPLRDGRLPREAYLEMLLLVCEHTWGLDTKKFLTDYKNWNRRDFEAARRHDLLEDSYGDVPGYEDAFIFARREFESLHPESVNWAERSYSFFERSHAEQRAYLAAAIDLLPDALRREAEPLCQTPAPALEGSLSVGYLDARWDGDELVCGLDGQALRIGLPLYQETGVRVYERFMADFLDNMAANRDWALPDNYKPGLEHSDAPLESLNHRPRIAAQRQEADGQWHWQGTYDSGPVETAGCPARFEAALQAAGDNAVLLTLRFTEKPASRKPEALFVPFSMPDAQGLSMRKIDEWVDAARTVPHGNQRVHGVQALRLTGAAGTVEITPLDTPLITIDQPVLLDFDRPVAFERVYAAVYNNHWGTNFKMWYSEDITCRFLIRWVEGR